MPSGYNLSLVIFGDLAKKPLQARTPWVLAPMAFCAILQFCVFQPLLEGQLQDPNGVANTDASEMPLFDELVSSGASDVQYGRYFVDGIGPAFRQGLLLSIFHDNLHNFASSK